MCTGEVLAHLDGLASKPTDVVLFGIEAHVCITQVIINLSQDLALFPTYLFFICIAPIAVGEVLPSICTRNFSHLRPWYLYRAGCYPTRAVLLLASCGRAAFSRAQANVCAVNYFRNVRYVRTRRETERWREITGRMRRGVFNRLRHGITVVINFDRVLPDPETHLLFTPRSIYDFSQTCLDLLEQGYGVHVVCDGVSSQK